MASHFYLSSIFKLQDGQQFQFQFKLTLYKTFQHIINTFILAQIAHATAFSCSLIYACSSKTVKGAISVSLEQKCLHFSFNHILAVNIGFTLYGAGTVTKGTDALYNTLIN